MTTLSIENRDMLHALSWYMSARKTALRAALSFRTNLSVTDQTDMRVHYSGYFLNLLAATELFRETQTLLQNDFKTRLNSSLVFEGFPDGNANYLYIRELRNAIVHRGLNITSAAHIKGDFPMILAEPEIQDRYKKDTFAAFGQYLHEIIEKCESVIGPLMFDCLKAAGIFEATIDAEVAVVEYREVAEQSHAMPAFVKAMAQAVEFKSEWAMDAHSSVMTKLIEVLMPCNVAKPSVP